jgi:uncharacterized membrane protein YeaQ/YmgE (transglycosylase-associated protein family)
MLVNILLWCLFGLVAGVVAQFIMPGKGSGKGLVLTILLGILGAVVGGYLSSHLLNWDVNSFSIQGFAVAVAGALGLLFLYRLVAPAAATR